MNQDLSKILENDGFVDDHIVAVSPFVQADNVTIEWIVFTKQGKLIDVAFDSSKPGSAPAFMARECEVQICE